MKLPTEKRKATRKNPKFLILFGKPKCGKTTILGGLDDNLIIDLEQGSSFVDALAIEVNNLNELKELKEELTKGEIKYKRITIDTATKLEELILPLAADKYRETPMGKNYKGSDIRKLPNGSGYLYIREAFKEVIEVFGKFTDTLILSGHTKDKLINKAGKELSENQLDLSGKLSSIISAQADALGFVYRKENQTIINFNGGGDSIVEARPQHLRGKEIVIAESDEEGNMTYFWDKIFLNE